MKIFSENSIFGMVLLLVFVVGGIVLQIFLSRKENKLFGLILPAITFGVSLLFVLNVANAGELSTVIVMTISTFLLLNIPTAVLLVIYAACRGKRKRQRDLEKMSVQDLG